MNKTQTTLLVVGTILFVLCGLFVPTKGGVSFPTLRHDFLFSGVYGYIDVVNLVIRWILIVVSTAVLIFLNRTPKCEEH